MAARREEAEQSLRFSAALLDAVGQAVVATDTAGQITYWNRAAAQVYGWTADEAMGHLLVDLIPSRQSVERTAALMTSVASGVAWTEDVMVRHRDGHEFPALVTATPVVDENGDLIATISVSTDITERKAAEEAAHRLSAIVESTGDAIISKTLTHEIVSWNRAAEELFGYPASEAIGQLISMLTPEDRADELVTVLGELAAGTVVRGLQTIRRRKDGSRVEVSLTVSPTYDAEGTMTGASAIARDITQRREMEDALEHTALYDSLTGLPNRVLLSDRLSQSLVIGKRNSTPVAVLFLGLDAFKTINDAAGHAVGDQVLVEAARRLNAATRESDTLARFGGDQFVVVCNNTDENAAEHAAARLLESLADPVDVSDTPMYLSASVGIAVSPPMDADALLSQADAAMYDAKARGRARARMFDAAQNPDAQERHQLSNDLRKALDQQALEVWYQPVVDLANGEMLGVEALCRWNHPDRGMVPPVSFVTVAEDTGLIGALDRWVLNRACHDTRVMVDSGVLGSYGYVGVNLSARNVADIALQETVTSAVQAAGIPYSRIALEVTETGAMSEPENAGRLLDELRDLGVAITLDDFGTGYSSLSYLHQFPISTVKIDRAFVQHIVENREDLAITVSIIDLARSAQLFTVAEAIETTDQLNLLRAMGCRAGQGYLWSPALPLEQLISLVNDQPNKRFRTWNGGGTTSRRPPNLEVTIGHGLKRLMDMHQQGASLDTIAAGLNKEGFKTPSDLRWHRSTVARVIADTLYPVRHQDGAPPGA